MSTRNTRPWLLMCALLAACLAWLPSPSQAQGRGAQQRSYTPPPPTYTAPRATYNNTPQQRSYSSSTSSTYRSSPSQQYLSGSNRSYGMGTNRSYGTGSPNLFNQRGRVANDNVNRNLFTQRSGGPGPTLFKNSAANGNVPQPGRMSPGASPFKNTGGNNRAAAPSAMIRNNPFAGAGQGGKFKAAANDNAKGSARLKFAPRNSISHSGPPEGSALARQAPLTGLFNAHARGDKKGGGGSNGGGGDDGGDDDDPPPAPDLQPKLVFPDPGF